MGNELYKWSKDGNKMIINSEFKTFNKQTNYISNGNIIANTIYGNYIRPYNETKCNGKDFPVGHLFKYDLQNFFISDAMKEYIRSLNRKIILYEIFIWKDGYKDIIGWLIEDNAKIIHTFCAKTMGDYKKRFSAIDTTAKILEMRG